MRNIRNLIGSAAVLLAIVPLVGCGDTADSLVSQQIAEMNELADAIESDADEDAIKEIQEPFQMTIQLADSRRLSLGRTDLILSPPDHGEAGRRWLPGEVKTSRHGFKLSPDLDPPLAETGLYLGPRPSDGARMRRLVPTS